MADVLEMILESRRRAVHDSKGRMSLDELDRLISRQTPTLKFKEALGNEGGRIMIIAEIKKKSPSAGLLKVDYVPSDLAVACKKGGAKALSVLTEPDYFAGSLLDLQMVKRVSQLPVLRKDFVFDPYQVAESRANGADAVLLIAEMLERSQLRELVACSFEYKLEPLVEVFSKSVLDMALESAAEWIGINTRNLRSLDMIPNNVEELSKLIPADRIIVAESGIKNAGDIKRLKSLPVRAALVGESLLRQDDLEKAVRDLVQAG